MAAAAAASVSAAAQLAAQLPRAIGLHVHTRRL